MDIKEVMNYISMRKFLPKFCGMEYTMMVRHKMRGKDGHNRPIEFTKQEKEKIRKGRILLNKHIKNCLKG